MSKHIVGVSEQSRVMEQAESLADMKAKQEGFERGSQEWESACHDFLYERYKHSSIPHISNPSPIGRDSKRQDFKKAETLIANSILKYEFGLKAKDFGFPKLQGLNQADREEALRKVVYNRYIKDTIWETVHVALRPLRSINKEDVLTTINKTGAGKASYSKLRANRGKYQSALDEFLFKVFRVQKIFPIVTYRNIRRTRHAISRRSRRTKKKIL